MFDYRGRIIAFKNYDERIYKFTEAVSLHLQKGVVMNYVTNGASCNINKLHA